MPRRASQTKTSPTTRTGKTRIAATFGNKPLYIPGPNYFTMRVGVAPGSGIVTMRESDYLALKAKNTGFELKIDDQQRQLTIKELYIKEVEHQSPVHEGENMVEVTIEDKRSLWRFDTVTGFFNILKDDGVFYIPASIKSGKPFTFDELAQKCLDALGTKAKANTGIAWTPENIEWEAAPAAAMLHQLLEQTSWEVVLDPDGKVRLIDLSKSKTFNPPSNHTVTADTTERPDKAHQTPQKLRVMFRIFRDKETGNWEPVLQYMGNEKASTGDTNSGNEGATGGVGGTEGEWDSASKVLASWGVSLAWVHKSFYKDVSNFEDRFLQKLGGGQLGRMRWQHIKAKLYRVWRLKDTDRDKILPLAPLVAKTGIQVGRQSALPARVTGADLHLAKRDNMRRTKKVGSPYFESGRFDFNLPYPVNIVDAKEGVVEIIYYRPLCQTVLAPAAKPVGWAAQDYDLVTPRAPRIVVGFYRKFDAADPEDSYFIVEKELKGENNGKTLTRLNERFVLRESFGLGVGEFQAQNQTDLEQRAQDYLDGWAERYTVPDPREVRIAGVDPQLKLTEAARAITIRLENGVETFYRINSDRDPSRYGLGLSGRERARRFVGKAAAAALVEPDSVRGGGGSTHAVGMLGATSPPIRDFVVSRTHRQTHFEWESVFINDEQLGLCVAQDWRNPPKNIKCKRATAQTTRSGNPKGPQTTGGVQISGIRDKGGTQQSGSVRWTPAG